MFHSNIIILATSLFPFYHNPRYRDEPRVSEGINIVYQTLKMLEVVLVGGARIVCLSIIRSSEAL